VKTLAAILILVSLLFQSSPSIGRDLFDVTFTPCQETFLYGSDPVLKIHVKNISGDTLWIRGISDFDLDILIEKGLGNPPDWNSIDKNYGGHGIFYPDVETEIYHSYSYKKPLEYSYHEENELIDDFFPIGTFVVYFRADGYVPETKKQQDKFIECEFTVRAPEGVDKEILDKYIIARADTRAKEYDKSIEIMESILKNHPESEYTHRIFSSLMGTYYLKYSCWESAQIKQNWADWYLSRYPEYYGEAMKKALGVLSSYYMARDDRQGLIERMRELNIQHPGTRLEQLTGDMISTYSKMSDVEFNKAHKLVD
jgi:hypothetical protein